jgi:hypothetical protein
VDLELLAQAHEIAERLRVLHQKNVPPEVKGKQLQDITAEKIRKRLRDPVLQQRAIGDEET